MSGVVCSRAVVGVTANAIAVGVVIWVGRARVTGVTHSVGVCVLLSGIRCSWAVVVNIGYAITVGVRQLSLHIAYFKPWAIGVSRLTAEELIVSSGADVN